MKKTFILIIVIGLVVIGYFLLRTPKEINNSTIVESTKIEAGYEIIERTQYSFHIPIDWNVSNPIIRENGCVWDGASNNGGDGHRQPGEIFIAKKFCYSLQDSGGGDKKIIEKDGYYIIASYDALDGTTSAEEAEIKEVYQKVISTFSVK